MSSLKTVFGRIPPPMIFIMAFLAGYYLQRAMVRGTAAPQLPDWIHYLGLSMVVVAALAVFGSIGLFFRRRTTVIPHGDPSALVTGGLYRWTRNPMYLGLTLAYLGMALALEAWGAVLLVWIPLLVLNRIIVPMEETRLRARFGEAYREYRGRVRRWL